ncbi:unnamed protein product [Camellia sinensis]
MGKRNERVYGIGTDLDITVNNASFGVCVEKPKSSRTINCNLEPLNPVVGRRGVGGLGEGEGGAAYREERGLQVVARKGEEGLRVGGEGAPGRRCWGELVGVG